MHQVWAPVDRLCQNEGLWLQHSGTIKQTMTTQNLEVKTLTLLLR